MKSSPLARALITVLCFHAGSGLAQQASAGGATVQQILDGKQLYISGKQAVVKQQARVPEPINTLRSRGQLRFSSGAVGRINRYSSMKLGSSCFLLERGQILVSGPQNGCTRSSRLSVRGTNYVMQVDASGQTLVSVLEGLVELQALRDGEPLDAVVPSLIKAGQQVRLDPDGVIALLKQLKRSDVEAFLYGPLFRGYQQALPYMGTLFDYLIRNYPGIRIPPQVLQQAGRVQGMPAFRTLQQQLMAPPARRPAPQSPSSPQPAPPADNPAF